MAQRALAVDPPLEHAALGQVLQPARQDVGRDAEAVLELVEAGEALQRIAQDQDAPPFADGLDRAGAGAFGQRCELGLHVPEVVE